MKGNIALYLMVIFLALSIKAKSQESANHSYRKFLKEYRKLKSKNLAVLNFDCDVPPKTKKYYSVDEKGKINSNAKNFRFTKSSERKAINKIFLNTNCYRDKNATAKGCFNPRMGFLFYSKDTSTILAKLDVCLECHNMEFIVFKKSHFSQIGIVDFGIKEMRNLCETLGLSCCGRSEEATILNK